MSLYGILSYRCSLDRMLEFGSGVEFEELSTLFEIAHFELLNTTFFF